MEAQQCQFTAKKKVQASSATHDDQGKAMASEDAKIKTQAVKKFSLCTYKLHAHGHMVQDIHTYGTTDLYSMEPVGVKSNLRFLCNTFPGRIATSKI